MCLFAPLSPFKYISLRSFLIFNKTNYTYVLLYF